jgi:ACS family tartrate transporter-like MFS transporter
MGQGMAERPQQQEQVFAKCAGRLIPFLMLLYFFNYLDRVNVGFAALTMNRDLGFSPSVYGLAASVFFISYALFQIPATMFLERIGARAAVAIIMASWGTVSAATALVNAPIGFYAARFLLGVAEAAFFPGMILYLTFWFPREYRARFTAIFMTAIPLSSTFGAPISGLILGLDGTGGLRGWQWLFLIEGVPVLALALAVLKFLPNGPAEATFLSEAEKQTIERRLAAERPAAPASPWPGLYDPRVLLLGLAGTGVNAAIFGNQLWLPQIVKSLGYSNLATGFIVSLPYLLGIPIMLLVARSSDRRGERVWHTAIPLMVTAAGFTVAAMAHNPFVVIGGLFAVVWGLVGTYGPYYSQASSFFAGPAAPGAIALVNLMCTGAGGFIGPNVVGLLKQHTGGYAAGMLALSAGLVISVVLLLLLGRVMAARRLAGG